MADNANDPAPAVAAIEVRKYDTVEVRGDDGEFMEYAAIKTRDDYRHAKRLLAKYEDYVVMTAAGAVSDPRKLRWHEDGPEPEAATAPAPGRVDPEDLRLPMGTVSAPGVADADEATVRHSQAAAASDDPPTHVVAGLDDAGGTRSMLCADAGDMQQKLAAFKQSEFNYVRLAHGPVPEGMAPREAAAAAEAQVRRKGLPATMKGEPSKAQIERALREAEENGAVTPMGGGEMPIEPDAPGSPLREAGLI